VILSAHGDDAYVQQVAALGAAGYLLKQSSARFLAEAIRQVHLGKTCFSPSLVSSSRPAQRPGAALGSRADTPPAQLSSREVEVLQRIAEGGANKQVAAELGISVKTVEKHRQHLMEKLRIHDTAGLTRYAIAAGIVESSIRDSVFSHGRM
jgi:DNA-binding NarL/FixJ family response regulator